MAGIYLHIPFCRKACHYCDFHFSVSMRNKGEVLGAMKKELLINRSFLENEPVNTIYFGGGTPSVLSKLELAGLLDLIRGEFNVAEPEITLEANPDDLDPGLLSSLREAGINRLSIGIQSFHDKDLLALNRSHDRRSALNSIEESRRAGFSNINIDLIYGLPDSSLLEWQENLDIFSDLQVPHLSAYSLTYEEKTAFGNWLKKGKIQPLNEEVVIEEFTYLMNFMNEKSYEHYEISNFSLPGMRSVHNTSYWKGEKYLGIGPSAHSYNGAVRRWNLANNTRYVNALGRGVDYFEQEVLSEKDRFNEYLMISLRTIWGLSLEKLESEFGKDRADQLQNDCAELIEQGFLTTSAGALILTEKGKLVADKITSDLFEV